MIITTGLSCLLLGLLLACLQGALPWSKRLQSLRAIESIAVLQFVTVLTAFASLAYAYIVSDFSVANVAFNSNKDTPLLYKISGVWGNHEGSMLLWVLVLTGINCAFALTRSKLARPFKLRVLGVLGIISAGFHLFLVSTSNPFWQLAAVPTQGQGLNPLLEDPALAIHPPLLYIGYVGFVIAFAFAIAALLERRVDDVWALTLRPWCLSAWSFLTLGIATGSFWAYYELGWGGWWFWDPVENAALMPWITGTALIHSLGVLRKRASLKNWAILLSIITFGLSLIGMFIVRSGTISSVHAFALDPTKGSLILVFLALIIGSSLTLFALRAHTIGSTPITNLISREGGVIFGNLILCTLAGIIFIGTLYPLFLETITGEKISIGAPYFNTTIVPLILPMLAVMAIVPMLGWQQANLRKALEKLIFALVAAMAVAVVTWYFSAYQAAIVAILLLAVAVWLFTGTMISWYNKMAHHGLHLAHIGVAVLVVGATINGFWQEETVQTLSPGQATMIGGRSVTLVSVTQHKGPNYLAEKATLVMNNRFLYPEKRFYPLHEAITAETAILPIWFSNIYAALGDFQGDNKWMLRLYWHPMVNLIWLGAMLMALGGFLTIFDDRHRRLP